MFAVTARSLRTVAALQNDAQLYLLNNSNTWDRESVADTFVGAALTLLEAGAGRHSEEYVALSRAFDVVAAGIPAVNLRKPVSLAKRIVPNTDTALRSGLPVGVPHDGRQIIARSL